MENQNKTTPLFEQHVADGAKMGNFGGYQMPLWYPSGPKDEHLSVIQRAGIFDTSHMAAITVKGADSYELLQHCFTKNLGACIGLKKTPLVEGRCVYGLFLNEQGGVIDDALVYQCNDNHYMIIVNAAMGSMISSHLKRNNQGGVEINDLTDKLGKVDIQGPKSVKILEKLIQNPDVVLEKMPYFSFKGYFDPSVHAKCSVTLLDGTPILLSRTGYTGEFGFEIFIESNAVTKLWEKAIEAGKEYNAITCGLAARDSLRVGAVLPLSHQDIGDWPFCNNPWPFALSYDDDGDNFTKKSFIGAESFTQKCTSEFTFPFVGFDPRKIIPGEGTSVVDKDNQPIGSILTCATDMAIGRAEGVVYSIASSDIPESLKIRGLCCGFVKTTIALESGQIVYLKDAKRQIKVEIVKDIRPARTARIAIKKMRDNI